MSNCRIGLGCAMVCAVALAAEAARAASQAVNPLVQEMQGRYPQADLLDGFLVTAVLLFAMSIVSIIAWWNARQITIFRTLAAYLFTIAVSDVVEFRGLAWLWIPPLVLAALNFELFPEALRIPKRPWIWVSRLLWPSLLVAGLVMRAHGHNPGLVGLWGLRLMLYPDLALIAVGVIRGGRV